MVTEKQKLYEEATSKGLTESKYDNITTKQLKDLLSKDNSDNTDSKVKLIDDKWCCQTCGKPFDFGDLEKHADNHKGLTTFYLKNTNGVLLKLCY